MTEGVAETERGRRRDMEEGVAETWREGVAGRWRKASQGDGEMASQGHGGERSDRIERRRREMEEPEFWIRKFVTY
jgi:hypothetical protein